MSAATHAVFIFFPHDMSYAKTPFEGEREEMLKIATELQELAVSRQEKGMYVVRPVRDTGDQT